MQLLGAQLGRPYNHEPKIKKILTGHCCPYFVGTDREVYDEKFQKHSIRHRYLQTGHLKYKTLSFKAKCSPRLDMFLESRKGLR